MVTTTVALVIFNVYIGIRMTSRIIGPLKGLQMHLRRLSQGNLFQKKLGVRKDDEFHDLVAHYNYFYGFLQAQAEADLSRLETLERQLPDSPLKEQISEIIEEKMLQLGRSPTPRKGQKESLTGVA
jgi:nitrogen fixation/metabolism regulation signal transduction histidine kinase